MSDLIKPLGFHGFASPTLFNIAGDLSTITTLGKRFSVALIKNTPILGSAIRITQIAVGLFRIAYSGRMLFKEKEGFIASKSDFDKRFELKGNLVRGIFELAGFGLALLVADVVYTLLKDCSCPSSFSRDTDGVPLKRGAQRGGRGRASSAEDSDEEVVDGDKKEAVDDSQDESKSAATKRALGASRAHVARSDSKRSTSSSQLPEQPRINSSLDSSDEETDPTGSAASKPNASGMRSSSASSSGYINRQQRQSTQADEL